MKRIISAFIILVITGITLYTNIMAFCANSDYNDESLSHEMHKANNISDSNKSWNKWSKSIWNKNSNNNTHKCCFSPLSDKEINWNIIKTNSKKDLYTLNSINFSFINIEKDILEQNIIDKLNSPPKIGFNSNLKKSLYINLTGIIKNNC